MTSQPIAAALRRRALAAPAAATLVPRRAGAHADHEHRGAAADPDDFAVAMAVATARMHRGMQAAPEGDPARDFARMMVAHHQGAVDMALALLRWGADGPMRRLAQAIVVEQRGEIEVMQRYLRETAPPG